jgi:hypothetical protein
MMYLTKEIKLHMPRLYSMEQVPAAEKVVQVKYFTPDSNWTWYACEADAVTQDGDYISLADSLTRDDIQDVIFFGFVEGHYPEWGYFSLREMISAKGPMGLSIERDRWFGQMPMYQALPNMFDHPSKQITIAHQKFACRRRQSEGKSMIPEGARWQDYFTVRYDEDERSMRAGLVYLALNIDAARDKIHALMIEKRAGWKYSIRQEREFINASRYYAIYLRSILAQTENGIL